MELPAHSGATGCWLIHLAQVRRLHWTLMCPYQSQGSGGQLHNMTMNMEHYTDWTCRKTQNEKDTGIITTDVVHLTPWGLQIPWQVPVFSQGFKVSSSKAAAGAVLVLFLWAMTKNSLIKLWPVDNGSRRTPRNSLEYARKPDDELLRILIAHLQTCQNELWTGNNGQDWHLFCTVQPLASLNIKA